MFKTCLTLYSYGGINKSMETKNLNNFNNKGQVFLKSYMDMTGITVAELAKKTGLTRQFIYLVLDGTNQIGLNSARKLHKTLGVSYDKIL